MGIEWRVLDKPEIGDVDEGIVEGGEDTGDTEDEFTWYSDQPLSLRRTLLHTFSDLRP